MAGMRANSAGWALAAMMTMGAAACGSAAKSNSGVAGSDAGGAPTSSAGTSSGTGGMSGTSGGATSGASGTAGTTHSGGTSASAGMGGSGGTAMRPVAPTLPAGWVRSEFKGHSGQPSAVIDSKGTAYVVAAGSALWLASLDAKGWGTPQSLSDVSEASVAIAIDAQDRGIAVWEAGAEDTVAARTASYDPQGGWVMGGAIGTAPLFPSEIDLALSKNGSALVVWMDGNDNAAFVRGAQLTGKVWSAPVEIAPSPFASLVRPALGIDDQGHGAVIWRHADDGIITNSCHASVFDGQMWSPPARVGGPANGCYLPDFAMRGNGDGVAVYETIANVTALSYTVAGGFGTNTMISATPDTAYAAMPSLELNATGQGLVAFRESATKDAPFSPFFNTYKAGTGWGQATLITGSTGDMDPSAKVGVNASGQGIATWTTTDHRAGYRSVYASRYSPQTGFEPAILLDAGLNAGGGVQMAADINDAGNIVVAWDRRDDAGDHTMAAYYAAP